MLKGKTLLIITIIIIIITTFNNTPKKGYEYTEQRCMDTTTLESQGYKLDHIDSNNCRIVTKRIDTTTTQKAVICAFIYCTGMTEDQMCKSYYGPDWKIKSSQYAGNGLSEQTCILTRIDTQGGLIAVTSTCNLTQNEIVVAENFGQGSVLKKEGMTRYPISKLCQALPIVVVDTSTSTPTVRKDTSIYQTISNGGSFTVPENNVITFYYITENNYGLSTICKDSSGALYLQTGKANICGDTISGILNICGPGQIDPTKGECMSQQTSYQCDDPKATYNIETKNCTYIAPTQHAPCGLNCYWSINTQACICYAEKRYNCLPGYDFQEPKTKSDCQAINGIWDECPQCPLGEVCEQKSCVPECNKGQICSKPTTEIECQGSYDNTTKICYTHITEEIVCEDQSITPTLYNGEYKCYKTQSTTYTTNTPPTTYKGTTTTQSQSINKSDNTVLYVVIGIALIGGLIYFTRKKP